MFTSANIFLGFVAILQAFEGALAAKGGAMGVNPHFTLAAKAILFAVLFDGLDGRIARMTNTTSDFGRELDSLADVITFGIAPAVLVFVWGVLFVSTPPEWHSQLTRAGYMAAFFYLLCGAVRLARFNVQTNPTAKASGRADFKHFVGVPYSRRRRLRCFDRLHERRSRYCLPFLRGLADYGCPGGSSDGQHVALSQL